MDETKDINNAQVIIQNYDPDTMDPQELATLLEQTGGASEEGCVQIVDGDGNLITITANQLAAAGIDLANISESDVDTLLQLANQAGSSASVSSTVDSSALMNSSTDTTENSSSINVTSSLGRKRDSPIGGFADTEHGSSKLAKLTSTSNGMDASTIMSNQLTVNGTLADVTELDQETLASLMENGSVKFVDEQGNEIPASAILSSSENGGQTVTIEQHINGAPRLEVMTQDRNAMIESQSIENKLSSGRKREEKTLQASPNKPPQTIDDFTASGYALIGALVDVKRPQGPPQPAVVRYVRPGVGYKVQFQDDNRFEWVSDNDIIPRPLDEETSENNADSQSIDDIDAAPPKIRPSAGLAHNSGAVTTYAGRRTASSQLHQQKALLHSASYKRASNAAVAASKKVAHDGCGAASDSADVAAATNFVCPVCEKKIYNKQPSYIVIRLPACDTCAESKILVLDDAAKRP